MAEIVCPECGQVTTLTAIRRAADEFCAHCDYPLFWAPTAAAARRRHRQRATPRCAACPAPAGG